MWQIIIHLEKFNNYKVHSWHKNTKEILDFILVSRNTIPFANKEIFPKEQYLQKIEFYM